MKKADLNTIRFTKSDGVSRYNAGEEELLLTPLLTVQKISGIESHIWSLCDGKTPVNDIVKKVSKAHGTEQETVIKSIRNLANRHLISSAQESTDYKKFVPGYEWYTFSLVGLKNVKVPLRIWLSLVEDCNFKCYHCESWKTKHHMTTTAIENLIKKISTFSCRNPTIWLINGDHLLYPRILCRFFEACKHAWPYDIPTIIVTTNGTLLDNLKETLSFIDNLSFPLKPSQTYHVAPQHEIRPFYPILYDYDSKEFLESGKTNLRHIFFNLDLDCLYLQETSDHLISTIRESVKMLREKKIHYFYSLTFLGKITLFVQLLEKIRKELDENEIFIRSFSENLGHEKMEVLLSITKNLNVSFMDDMLYRVYEPTLRSGFILPKIDCGAGMRNLAINASGEVYPCKNFLNNKRYLLGDLTKESMDDIINSANAKKVRQEIERKVRSCLHEKHCCMAFLCAGCISSHPISREERCEFAQHCLDFYLRNRLYLNQRYLKYGPDRVE